MFAAQHPQMLDKLVILNAPHPSLFGRELRENPAQQQASQYMLMFRSAEAEALLSENSFAWLKRAVFGPNASEVDTAAYVEAWSQPGALTGGLNYYRASAVGPPPPRRRRRPPGGSGNRTHRAAGLVVRVPTLVIWGEKDTALLTGNLNGLDTGRAETDDQAHPGRHPLDRSGEARGSEQVHSRVPGAACRIRKAWEAVTRWRPPRRASRLRR